MKSRATGHGRWPHNTIRAHEATDRHASHCLQIHIAASSVTGRISDASERSPPQGDIAPPGSAKAAQGPSTPISTPERAASRSVPAPSPSRTPSRDTAAAEVESELTEALAPLPPGAREGALRAHIVALNEQITEQEAMIFMLRCELQAPAADGSPQRVLAVEDASPASPQTQVAHVQTTPPRQEQAPPEWAKQLLKAAAASEAEQAADKKTLKQLLSEVSQLKEAVQNKDSVPAVPSATVVTDHERVLPRGGSFALDGSLREDTDVDVRSVLVDGSGSVGATSPSKGGGPAAVDSVTAHKYYHAAEGMASAAPAVGLGALPGVGPLMGALQATQTHMSQLQGGLGQVSRIWGMQRQAISESTGHMQLAAAIAQRAAAGLQAHTENLKHTERRLLEAVATKAGPSELAAEMSQLVSVAARGASAAAAAQAAADGAASRADRATGAVRAAAADTARKLAALQADSAHGFAGNAESLAAVRKSLHALNRRVAAIVQVLQEQGGGGGGMYQKRYVYSAEREARAQRQAAGMPEPPSPQQMAAAGLSATAVRQAIALSAAPPGLGQGGVAAHIMSPPPAGSTEPQELSSSVQIPPQFRRGGGGTTLQESELAKLLEAILLDVRNVAKVVNSKKNAQRVAGMYVGGVQGGVQTPPRHPSSGSRGGFSSSAGAAARSAAVAALDTSGGASEGGGPMGASPAHSVGSAGSAASAAALEESAQLQAQFGWTVRAASAPSRRPSPSQGREAVSQGGEAQEGGRPLQG